MGCVVRARHAGCDAWNWEIHSLSVTYPAIVIQLVVGIIFLGWGLVTTTTWFKVFAIVSGALIIGTQAFALFRMSRAD